MGEGVSQVELVRRVGYHKLGLLAISRDNQPVVGRERRNQLPDLFFRTPPPRIQRDPFPAREAAKTIPDLAYCLWCIVFCEDFAFEGLVNSP